MVNSWKYFKINLYDSYGTYMAGDLIMGKVEFCLLDRVKINGIKLRLMGQAKVNWTEKKGNGRFETSVTFNENENYVDIILSVLSKKNGQDLYLDKGKYTFPFEIRLPSQLPTSIEHTDGRIRYFLCSTIEIPWGLNKTYKLPITIISLLDLNRNLQLKLSQSVTNHKTICCLCCSQKPINIWFNLYKTGYVCGEAIVFNATLNNQSSRKIPLVVLKLVQILKFHTKSKVKTIAREVTHIVFNKEIQPMSRVDWDNSVLTIPSVCPSSQNTSRLIEVSYTLVLSVEPSWPSSPLALKIPITIGSVPFRSSSFSNFDSLNNAYDLPTYQECVFDIDSSNQIADEQNDDINFAPLYPIYSNSHNLN